MRPIADASFLILYFVTNQKSTVILIFVGFQADHSLRSYHRIMDSTRG